MEVILPFRLKDKWFGMSLDKVLSVNSCGKIAMTPTMQKPAVGLMQKRGVIISVWSLFSMINESDENVKTCQGYIEMQILDKKIALPVNEILPVTEVSQGWVPYFKYGLKIFSSLDKQKPNPINKVQEVNNKKNKFISDSELNYYAIEEIGDK